MEITQRTANLSDANVLLIWRNTPSAREFSSNPELIPIEEHLEWFSDRLERANFEPFLIFSTGQDLIGMTRLDAVPGSSNEYVISILVDPMKQKLGVGTKILKMTCDYFFNLNPQKTIIAMVHQHNLISQNLFHKASFKLRSTQDTYLEYEKKSK